MYRETVNAAAELDLDRDQRVAVVFPAITVDSRVAAGVGWGVVTWLAYALVEYVLCCILPLLSTDRAVFVSLNWSLTAWLFNAYWILGAAAGAMCGLALAGRRGATTIRLRLACMFSLYVALLLNFLCFPRLDHGAKVFLAMDAVLVLATGWVLLRPHSRLVPWLRLPPLAAALLVVGPSWMANDLIGTPVVLLRRLSLFLLVAGILIASRLLNRYRDWGPLSHLSGTLALLLLTVGASAMVSGGNRVLPPSPTNLAKDPGLAPVVLVTFDTTRADHASRMKRSILA